MNCHIAALAVCFSFLTAWFQNGCINDTTHLPTKYSFIGMVLSPIPAEKKADGRSRVDRDADNHQLLQLEEKDVVSTVATALSDICGPGEWMPMEKLHAVLLEKYANVWHHSRVRRYLTSEDWPGPESKGKPWYGLLMLLRKYPEHFVINTRSKGRVTLEFVSLVSLLS
ncbi:fha domain-containing protein fha2 [Quercus suber]|uniref:Fha domain-containing protein fha2 n=1 Tax=Quercus suber TaxID=58331 RepID=A0AAW0LIK1_QUESU|nr:FHA domain-containing protein FHA2-like [Quercus suber]